MDFIEVEGKTYEDAIRKASLELNAEERDLEIDVKEIDTKGILGFLGSKKVRITARIKKIDSPEIDMLKVNTLDSNVPETDTIEEYGKFFLEELSKFVDLNFNIKVTNTPERLMFLIQCDHGDILIGKDGETLEALQHILRLAIAKRYKQGLKLLVDINGYREKRKKGLTIMVKRLADKVKRTGRIQKTDPLNPYERRVVHTLFKNNRNVSTKSEGEGHTKRVVISPRKKNMNGKR
ncbi:MAG: Jag N-terminal domain-containing protein [Proteobacteria bacterium]|nr:Jag N-terminal domain-containing protein [Pseudomonadota bacterium]